MVINSDERKLICSAAAGSGKTAVMIERVLRLIREGADSEAFLIVTFTNAAAAEMKEKIRNRLREQRKNTNIREAYNKIDMMEISTIHSFCQRLIRQEFQAAGVDPMFRICEAGIRQKLFDEAFSNACDKLLKENVPLAKLSDDFSPKKTLWALLSPYFFLMIALLLLNRIYPVVSFIVKKIKSWSNKSKSEDIPDNTESPDNSKDNNE